MKRTLLLAVPVLLLAGAGGWLLLDRDPAVVADPAPPAAAKITRGTITQTEDVDGTLDFGAATTVVGRLPGMITALPGEGRTVERGQPLYQVDGTPVAAHVRDRAAVPCAARRRLGRRRRSRSRGNLSALGFKGFTVDDSYTSATASAVRDWQEGLGLPETGTSSSAGSSSPRPRSASARVKGRLGDNATGPVLALYRHRPARSP